ncbi:nucleotidyltransferase family protein [Gracilinema caldarium]|uniref:DNA polymerase beta domain protein region n=1 Tax=Gracilinema caldarium (strain ATCC 51460 / DSM 7334 / H1) TaxID=744872 RepID=F8EYA5_GRAC1|nr:nucleotidyltransferase domain-containing protein [Gracilinema caldarium]AEJ18264.1 DNA polymerase beta domain protein region [Gracilinema caldarium DSM 7334]
MNDSAYVDTEREQAYEALLRERVLSLCAGLPCTIYLFGSRARKQARRSSDFDIGIEGLDTQTFRRLKIALQDWLEESPIPHTIDVIDFSHADPVFVIHAKKDAIIWKKN